MDYTELAKSLRYVADNKPVTSPEILTDAADAIEELEKKMLNWQATADDHWDAYHHWFDAYMRDVPKWIPVTERLPENKRKTYLILTDSGYECDARWTDNIYGLGQSDRWGWCLFDIPQYSKVTHWMPRMPLPKPPKEETE